MEKYIIINADAIQKRIEELEEYKKTVVSTFNYELAEAKLYELRQVLVWAIHLTPEIKKAFDAAKSLSETNEYGSLNYINADNYIKNLKLPI